MSEAIQVTSNLQLYPNEYYTDVNGKRFRVVYDPIVEEVLQSAHDRFPEVYKTCGCLRNYWCSHDTLTDVDGGVYSNFGSMQQPNSVPNSLPPTYLRVIKDIEDRVEIGEEQYGVKLQPFNGRNALIDLYQELLDAVLYLRQHLDEDLVHESLR